jgi:hypothetical protein
VRDVLTPLVTRARRVICLDVHSGLGPSGVDSIMAGDKREYVLCTDIFPSGCLIDEPTMAGTASSGYQNARGSTDIKGLCCPDKRFDLYLCTTQEFGTVPSVLVVRALVLENNGFWLARGSPIHRMTQEMVRAAFYVESRAWKESVLHRGRERIEQALAYLRKSN